VVDSIAKCKNSVNFIQKINEKLSFFIVSLKFLINKFGGKKGILKILEPSFVYFPPNFTFFGVFGGK
jgi:hypothetical protein